LEAFVTSGQSRRKFWLRPASTRSPNCAFGPAKAYARAKSLKPRSVSLNLLWAIAAGLEDRDWRDLTPTEKDSLLAQIRSFR
jgi:hypothetical protein